MNFNKKSIECWCEQATEEIVKKEAIAMNKTTDKSISDMLTQGNTISEIDLNNLCYIFNELLEASLCIQWQIQQHSEQTDDMNLKLFAEGFDNIINQNHKRYLEIKKQNQWDQNIGEEYK